MREAGTTPRAWDRRRRTNRMVSRALPGRRPYFQPGDRPKDDNGSIVTMRGSGIDECVHPADWDEVQRAVAKITLKDRVLHDEHLPKTVSAVSDLSSSCRSDPADPDAKEPGPGAPPPQCPCHVMGRVSDVADDYIISPTLLGEGQYGRVRECVHRATGRTYAVKSVDKSRAKGPDQLRREVRVLSEVDHPGIVRMVDCHEDEDHVHIVTERYAGGELFDRVVARTTDDGCYPERTAARIARSLLGAVAHLHDRGIVHRDVKPENVLFETRRESSPLRLIDFGLSRRHARGDPPLTSPVGTSYYMSPEVIRGKYDAACDVWAAGVIAYVCLCGYPPFNGASDDDIFERILEGTVKFPEQQWANKSAEARDFVRCLLRRDPRKRFTAREALAHPWIARGRGRRGTEGGRRRSRSGITYLRIP